MLQLRQQLSRSSPSLALQNLPAGLQISVQGTTDPLSKQPSLVVQLLQPEGLAGSLELARGGQQQEMAQQGTSSQHEVGSDFSVCVCASAQGYNFMQVIPVQAQHSDTTWLLLCISTPSCLAHRGPVVGAASTKVVA